MGIIPRKILVLCVKSVRLCLTLGTILVVVTILPPSRVSADEPLPIFMGLTFFPPYVYAGIPSEVSVDIGISNPDLVKSSVSLFSLDENNTPTFIGYLHDDGINGGDVWADDNLFTTRLTFTENQPRIIKFLVSADIKGTKRSSPIVNFEVKSNPNFEKLWAEFVDRMVNQDLEGALLYIRKDERAKHRSTYRSFGMENVSASYQTARDLTRRKVIEGYAELSFTITTDSVDRDGRVIFFLDPDGAWRISVLGFR